MATRDGNIKYDEQFVIEHLWDIPNFKRFKNKTAIKEFIKEAVKVGLIDRTPITELYTAEVIDSKVISEDGRDLENDGDVKTGTPTLTSYGKSYSARISGLENKIGDLYVITLEPITKKFYYFLVPRKSYIGRGEFRIPFEFNGDPKRENHWWNYETNRYFNEHV